MNEQEMIDLRSNTVTEPCTAMRAAMSAARLGDDVYGEDPTVNALEAMLAARAGMECGLFMPSGTQSNLVALLTHCGRGDEYIVGQQAHTYKYEGGGAAALGGIQPQPLEFTPSGGLDFEQVEAAIKPADHHFAKTRLLCLENTMQGRVLPPPYLRDAVAFARRHGLKLHLDGARLFNAAVATGQEINALVSGFDSVSICLSKGLGAPVGSVLLGSASFIEEARRWRKVCGGGMRQAGVLAAAGIYALENNVQRLVRDHDNAARLAAGLSAQGFMVEPVHTNMVFVHCGAVDPSALRDYLLQQHIRISVSPRLRLVTHLNIDEADISRIIEAFARFSC